LVHATRDAFDGFVALVLSLSKGERFCSWFDKLTTSGYVLVIRRTALVAGP
jgi:hypothetical protein